MVDITLSFASQKCGEERDSVYAKGRRVSGYPGVKHLSARINFIIRAAPAACIITTVFLLWQIARMFFPDVANPAVCATIANARTLSAGISRSAPPKPLQTSANLNR
jgi:hypothetical protein